jgi:hypothetical protein
MSTEELTSVRLSADQAELLNLSAAAYEQRVADGQKETIGFYSALGVPTSAEHPGLPGGAIPIDLGDLEELFGYGLIDVSYSSHGDHSGTYRVTNDGYSAVEQIEEHERALASPTVVPEEGKGMGFDWVTDALPVLQAVDRLWRADPTVKGVNQAAIKQALGRDPEDMHTSVILRKLKEHGFIQGMGAWQGEGPVLCEPTTKAFEYLAGWPSERGDMALARFVEALEARIEATEDPVEKGRLGKVLDSVNEVGQGVMAGVLTNLITGGS